HGMGIETGVDLDKLIEAGNVAEHVIGRPLPGKVHRAGPSACAAPKLAPARTPLFPSATGPTSATGGWTSGRAAGGRGGRGGGGAARGSGEGFRFPPVSLLPSASRARPRSSSTLAASRCGRVLAAFLPCVVRRPRPIAHAPRQRRPSCTR